LSPSQAVAAWILRPSSPYTPIQLFRIAEDNPSKTHTDGASAGMSSTRRSVQPTHRTKCPRYRELKAVGELRPSAKSLLMGWIQFRDSQTLRSEFKEKTSKIQETSCIGDGLRFALGDGAGLRIRLPVSCRQDGSSPSRAA
jgi:hypothetical protein